MKKLSIRKAIIYEFNIHPAATLIDIYKFFFQDEFGPGHLIIDHNQAWKMLCDEVSNNSVFDRNAIQPLGYQKKFYRVNLSLVKYNQKKKKELFDCFVKSVNMVIQPTLMEWKSEWEMIYREVLDVRSDVPNLFFDKELIDEKLSRNEILFSHSDNFKKNYNPHYRIIFSSFISRFI